MSVDNHPGWCKKNIKNMHLLIYKLVFYIYNFITPSNNVDSMPEKVLSLVTHGYLSSAGFPFSSSLVCQKKIQFGRRLLNEHNALRRIWKGSFKGDGWSEGKEGARAWLSWLWDCVKKKAAFPSHPQLKWTRDEILQFNKVTARKVWSQTKMNEMMKVLKISREISNAFLYSSVGARHIPTKRSKPSTL